eukprot:TRINITY_DN28157_c0_g1_i1.p1 TRINITY_DN28157_c0_g1~~TRINITY_DN28157_c0_g1_i1.p1  ORF type:complete len:165 (-),score=42.85 TRINITY_DN28157_c0_g1_i1:81-575(-)
MGLQEIRLFASDEDFEKIKDSFNVEESLSLSDEGKIRKSQIQEKGEDDTKKINSGLDGIIQGERGDNTGARSVEKMADIPLISNKQEDSKNNSHEGTLSIGKNLSSDEQNQDKGDLGEKLRNNKEGKMSETSNLYPCLLYTSDAADDTPCVDLGGRRIIKKKKR